VRAGRLLDAGAYAAHVAAGPRGAFADPDDGDDDEEDGTVTQLPRGLADPPPGPPRAEAWG
jgi:hypothetical protein